MSHEWLSITESTHIEEIKKSEAINLIFKHSTRCPVSSFAKRRFESDWDCIPSNVNFYYLDLLKHRDLSNLVAETFQVHHESPQILLIKSGDCILEASHSNISAEEVKEVLDQTI